MHYAAPLRSAPMHLDDFRVMVDRLAREVPAEFHDGIVAIDVSPKTVPHPVHGDVYTLGECVPLEWSDSGVDLHSRIILYYGSFPRPPPPRGFALPGGGRGRPPPQRPPPGDAVLVVRPAPRLRDLFRRPPAPAHETVQATLVDA